jgi:uncharacterized protein (TIGR00297 family)
VTLGLAVALALVLAGAGRALGWLTTAGAIAAAAVGGTVFAATGLPGGILLASFFLSGSVLTYWGNGERGTGNGGTTTGNGERGTGNSAWKSVRGRTARQVIANGGWAAVGAAMVGLGSSSGWAVLAGALAAAQGDTWATEIGARSRRLPRLLTTWREVPAGTSGGITLLGSAAGVTGAAGIGVLGMVLGLPVAVGVAATMAGTLGLFSDSVLGASAQATYRCAACGAVTEEPPHCGRAATLVSGLGWLDNDAVNLAATTVGAAAAAAIMAFARLAGG